MIVFSTDCSEHPILWFALVDILDMSGCRSGFGTTFCLTSATKMATVFLEFGLEIGDGVGFFGSAVDVLDEGGITVVEVGLFHS